MLPVLRFLVLCAPAVLLAGCFGGDREGREAPWQRQTIWSDGGDRVEVEKQKQGGFPDAIVGYRVLFGRGAGSVTVLTGAVQAQSFHIAATRLPDGRVAWLAIDTLCTLAESGKPTCTDLGDMKCWEGVKGCSAVVPAAATCRSALGPPDAQLAAALRWVAGDKEGGPRQRVAALVALARSFEAPDAAVRTLEPFMETRSDELGLWFNGAVARVKGEAFRVDALRRKLSKGSHCEHVAIARSCVAELGPDVAAARAASAASHADWQAELAQAEKECAGLPRTAR